MAQLCKSTAYESDDPNDFLFQHARKEAMVTLGMGCKVIVSQAFIVLHSYVLIKPLLIG